MDPEFDGKIAHQRLHERTMLLEPLFRVAPIRDVSDDALHCAVGKALRPHFHPEGRSIPAKELSLVRHSGASLQLFPLQRFPAQFIQGKKPFHRTSEHLLQREARPCQDLGIHLQDAQVFIRPKNTVYGLFEKDLELLFPLPEAACRAPHVLIKGEKS